jgi:hypothetical protein
MGSVQSDSYVYCKPCSKQTVVINMCTTPTNYEAHWTVLCMKESELPCIRFIRLVYKASMGLHSLFYLKSFVFVIINTQVLLKLVKFALQSEKNSLSEGTLCISSCLWTSICLINTCIYTVFFFKFCMRNFHVNIQCRPQYTVRTINSLRAVCVGAPYDRKYI